MRLEEPEIANRLKALLPADEQTERGCDRVLRRLKTADAVDEDLHNEQGWEELPRSSSRRWIALTAAGLVLLLISIAVFRRAPKDEVSWGRSAAEYFARLSRFAESGRTVQTGPSNRGPVFEVTSIRPSGPNRGGGRGFGPQACGGDLQVEPRRFVARDVTLYRLIALAYGKDCIFLEQNGELLLGGPEWVRSAGFVIQAVIPSSAPAYTRSQLDTGTAPQLQEMLRNLLADRFNLALHSEAKDMPVYLLTAGNGASKLVPWKEGDPSRGFVGMAGLGDQRSFHIMGGKKSMAEFVLQLQDATRRPVIDRTGIAGEFNYDLRYAPSAGQVGAEVDGLSGPSLFTALQEQLNLKLDAARAPVQILMIDRAERPTEN
jgi:uncharacterized protein (TIGR03435 family)